MENLYSYLNLLFIPYIFILNFKVFHLSCIFVFFSSILSFGGVTDLYKMKEPIYLPNENEISD